jgi:hypothetical protein
MRKTTLAATLALATLGGCSGTGVIDYVHLEPGYRQQQFAYAAGGRDLKADIQGNPFAMPKEEFDATVTDAMQGAHFGQPTNFTTTPGDSAREGYRVRLLFNGPGASSGRIVCAGEPAIVGSSPESGNVRLLAAFCNGDYPLSYLSAHVSGITTTASRPAIARRRRPRVAYCHSPMNAWPGPSSHGSRRCLLRAQPIRRSAPKGQPDASHRADARGRSQAGMVL